MTAPAAIAFSAKAASRRLAKGPVIPVSAALAIAAAVGIFTYKRPLWVIDRAIRAWLKWKGVSSRCVKVGSYCVHYFEGGQGRPLLLIHGLGARSEYWAPQMPAYVANGFHLYALDLLGCGQTDRPDIAYTIQQQTNLVRDFMESLRIERADVVGWSMGGWVALQFALQHPGRIRRLVVMDSAGISFDPGLKPEVIPPRTPEEWRRMQAVLDFNPMRMPAFIERDLMRVMAQNAKTVRRAAESILSGEDLLDNRLGRIDAPVLIVWGEQDAMIPLSVGRRMHEAIPGSVLHIYSKCGHMGPATCASRIVPRVIEFLLRDPPPKGGIERY
jgi:pimeloyl-ACP methyl ester carboxylesterase